MFRLKRSIREPWRRYAFVRRSAHVECCVSDQGVFFDQGRKFAKVRMPCCGLATNLNALVYVSPAEFARSDLCAQNPEIGGLLSAEDPSVLEKVIGSKLRQVYGQC
jgi:hypothetical protein